MEITQLRFSNVYFRYAIYFLIANFTLFPIVPQADKLVYLICGTILFISSIFVLEQLTKNIKSKRFSLFAVLLTLFVALFAISPITVQAGWPFNHEAYNWKYRTITYYLHFLQFDFFPIWSSGDCYNLGAPLPLFYHKLFYYLSAMIYLFLGQMKMSIITTLIVFELIAVVGLYRCLSILDLNKYVALALSLLILLMNYTATDWLIRGNMAEFSALCLVPWLIHWCLSFIDSRRFSYTILPIFLLLFLAHNIIAFYGVFLVLFAIAIVFIVELEMNVFKHVVFRGLISAMLFITILSPYLVPMILISDDFNIEKIKLGMAVENRFEIFSQYFIDRTYIWRNSSYHLSVEINLIFSAFFGSILIGLLYKIYQLYGFSFQSIKRIILVIRQPIISFLLLSLFFFLYLQHPTSIWFYNIVPGAEYIQFPWRLLIYIQALLIILFGYLIGKIEVPWIHPKSLSFILLGCMLFNYPFLKYLNEDSWKWLPEERIEKIENKGVWGTGGEYIPTVEGIDNKDYQFYLNKYEEGIVSDVNCNVLAFEYSNSESIERKYLVKSTQISEIILPLNYSGLEEIYIIHENYTSRLHPFRISTDPRIRIKTPPGEYVIQVNLPVVGNAFRKLF